MGENPSLAIIASDNDDLPSPLRLPSLRRPQVRRFAHVFSSVRPPCLKFAGSSSSSVMVLVERSSPSSPISYHRTLTPLSPPQTCLLIVFSKGTFPEVSTLLSLLVSCFPQAQDVALSCAFPWR